MSSRNDFATTLYEASTSDSEDFESITHRMRDCFIAFGSDTEDNLKCVEATSFGASSNRRAGPTRKVGLLIRGTDHLVSDVVNELERDEVFELLRKHFADLTTEQIAAALRMTTMVLLSLERVPNAEPKDDE